MKKLLVVRKVAVVDDTRIFRQDVAQACRERGIECIEYRSADEARDGLLGNYIRPAHSAQLVFIDCSLVSQPPGGDCEGVELAKDVCKSGEMKGVAVVMYSRFLRRLPQFAAIRDALRALLDRFRATELEDLEGDRRVINADVEDCVRNIDETELIQRGLDRLWEIAGSP